LIALLTSVVATIGGTNVPTTYAGPQGSLVGVDQTNLELPRSLIGRSEVDLVLRVDDKKTTSCASISSNTVNESRRVMPVSVVQVLRELASI
jgi:uncharacterized protein (TIGR03437 family)